VTAPALSVILTTRDGWEPVERTVRCLAAQTVADRIELVLVSFAARPPADPPPAVARFAAHQVVSLPRGGSVAEANAAGVRRARAPVVALGEDHSYPLPDWAEALLARHAEPWAVVGPVVRNANPGTLVSWADFVLGYGPFAEGHPGGEVEAAPGHNSSYKRAVLERCDDRLEQVMAAEWVFHRELRAAGERVYVEPRAITRHVNFGLPGRFVDATFSGARAGAAVRANAWPAWRRAVYLLGAPLIAPLRFVRVVGGLTPGQRRRIPLARTLPAIVLGLLVDAAGQASGFARPAPEPARDADLELERLRFVTPADRADLP
jgi:hypothetical protein